MVVAVTAVAVAVTAQVAAVMAQAAVVMAVVMAVVAKGLEFRMRWCLMCFLMVGACALPQPPRLRIGEVKQRLSRFGVSTGGIMEAEELRAMLTRCPPEASGPGYTVPLERVRAAEGSMGAGVAVYDKIYFSIRLELTKSSPERSSRVQWVLDSAASNSLLTPAAASLLEAKGTGVTATADTASATGTTGFQQVDLGIASLMGGLESGPLKPVVMELPVDGTAGLLGLDFLSRHDIELRLRSTSPCATFHDAGATASGSLDAEGLSELVCSQLPSGLLATAVRLAPEGAAGGEEVRSVVDLGSTLTLCNWAAASAMGLSREDPRVRQTDDVVAGASGDPVRVSETTLALELGCGAQRQITISIADLPVFSAIGLTGPAAVLGLDALAPRAEEEIGSRVILATRDRRVWVETSES